MNQSETLYRLQKIDLEILSHQKRLQEIDKILANDEALQAAQTQVAAAESNLAPLRTRLRDLELETQSNEEKARSSDQQLYSGAVTSPKEMQDLQQEIVSLKKRHDELETMMLETMMAVEEAEADLGEVETNLASITATQGDEHRQLLAEHDDLAQRIEQLGPQRQQVLTEITPENRKLYDTMRVKRSNQPVAVMQGNTCSLCGVAQTMTIERDVRQGTKLVMCSNCARILVSI